METQISGLSSQLEGIQGSLFQLLMRAQSPRGMDAPASQPEQRQGEYHPSMGIHQTAAPSSSTGRPSPHVDLAFDFSGPVTSFTDSSAVASDSHATGRLADSDLPPESGFIGITEAGGGDSASDEDPMADVARMAPLGRLVSEMESVRRGSSSHHPVADQGEGLDRPSRKRARLQAGDAGASTTSYPSHDPMDPVEMGLCDMDESRELVST